MPDEEEGPSYYAVLNVSRDASDEEIKRTFRNLAQTYHPDKHSDAGLKAEASASFTLLQEAYEVLQTLQAPALCIANSRVELTMALLLLSQVLSDAAKRQVYDIYGKEGLASGLEVATTVNNVDELKQKWAKFKAQEVTAACMPVLQSVLHASVLHQMQCNTCSQAACKKA